VVALDLVGAHQEVERRGLVDRRLVEERRLRLGARLLRGLRRLLLGVLDPARLGLGRPVRLEPRRRGEGRAALHEFRLGHRIGVEIEVVLVVEFRRRGFRHRSAAHDRRLGSAAGGRGAVAHLRAHGVGDA
jgi:hypothetical protein